MVPKPTVLEQLEQAKVLNPEGLTPGQREAINKLTDTEVKQLIAIRRKVGDFSRPEHGLGVWIL